MSIERHDCTEFGFSFEDALEKAADGWFEANAAVADDERAWMLVELLGIFGFLHKHFERRLKAYGCTPANLSVEALTALKEQWYKDIAWMEMAMYEKMHALLTCRDALLTSWRQGRPQQMSDETYVAIRDTLFPNKPLSEAEWHKCISAEGELRGLQS